MKLGITLLISVILLLGLAACNQVSVPKGSDSSAENQSTTDSGGDISSSSVNNQQQDTHSAANNNQVSVKLADVVDGDTIKVNYNGKVETVRYLLIDTPEEKKPGVCVQPYAMDAAKRNSQLLNAGSIALEFEKGKSRTDKYGRLLAYVFSNGSSVQEALLKEGYARVAYVYEPPYKYLSQYQSDENTAKSKRLNIWSKLGYATDSGFRGCADSSADASSQQSSNSPSAAESSSSEFFANCTELRKKYPDGVQKGHPAYRAALDRDKDGVACEK